MKKIVMLVAALAISNAAISETFTYIVPSNVDGGTAKWAQKFTKEWNKQLGNYGHDVLLRYIPGGKGTKAFGEWQTKHSNDDTYLIQSNGMLKYVTSSKGWKGYKPSNQVPVGGQIQSTYQFAKTGLVPGVDAMSGHIDGGAEVLLDAMAINMIACGPTLVCKTPINWVKGFKNSGERRKAFINDEIQLSRDGFAHKNKTYKKGIKAKETYVWYNHGMVGDYGMVVPDLDMPGMFFPTVYEKKWGVKPSGEYYEAYKQTLKMRSGLGKMILTKNDNKYYDVLVKSFNDTINDSKSIKTLKKKLGNGPFISGDVSKDHVNSIWGSLDEDTYRSMVKYRKEFGENTSFRLELVGLGNDMKHESYSWFDNLIEDINNL